MKHLAETDGERHTVIMIQVENEIGMLESARDHSEEANRLFNAPVPNTLLTYLTQNRKTLHPWLAKKDTPPVAGKKMARCRRENKRDLARSIRGGYVYR